MEESNNVPVQEFPDELVKRARDFFTKGVEVGYALQYDYAVELYLDGLSFWPEAVEEGHVRLREISLRRQAAGGKKAGFGDGSKSKKGSGKNPRDMMLKAEYLLSKDPHNHSHMADMAKAAVEANFHKTAIWVADILFEANLHSDKPSFQTYVLLKDVYSQVELYSRAVQACQLALQMKPKEGDLGDVLRDLSARATMQQGRYDDDSDFRESIKDREDQEKLQSQENIVRSDTVLEDVISQARKQYDQDPSLAANIDKLVKALCDTEKDKYESQAMEVLEKAYADSGQFNYKQRAGEISMKMIRRQTRRLQLKLKNDPDNQQLQQQLNQVSKSSLEAEMDHYKLCVENYPTDRRMKYEYGRRLLRTKQFDEAIPMFQEARSDPRHRIVALNCIGQCFFYKGWYPDAVESFQQAFDQLDNKEDSMAKELLYNLGRAYESDENIEQALNCYRQVAQIDFNYRDARDRVDSLRKKERDK